METLLQNTCTLTSENKVDSINVSDQNENAQSESISTVTESEGVKSVSKEAELPESKYESDVTHDVKGCKRTRSTSTFPFGYIY